MIKMENVRMTALPILLILFKVEWLGSNIIKVSIDEQNLGLCGWIVAVRLATDSCILRDFNSSPNFLKHVEVD